MGEHMNGYMDDYLGEHVGERTRENTNKERSVGAQGMVLDVSGDELTVSVIRTEARAKRYNYIPGLLKEEMIVKVKNGCDAHENDEVRIELKSNYAIRAALILYGIPLVFLIVGAVFGYFGMGFFGFMQIQDTVAFTLSVLGIVLAFLFIRARDKRIDRGAYTPVATSVVHCA